MSDVLGVGRIVDEASEVLDSLDRPFLSRTTVERIGRKTITSNFSISKLDAIFLTIIFCMFVQAMEHRLSTGKSWARHLDIALAPFGLRLIGASNQKQTADEGELTKELKDKAASNRMLAMTLLGPAASLYQAYQEWQLRQQGA